MVYHYRTGVLQTLLQKFFKQVMVAVAAIFIATIASLSASTRAVSVPEWNLEAGGKVVFNCGGSDYTHTLSVVTPGVNGAFSGSGFYDATPTYTWSMVGSTTGDTATMTITYTGTEAGYIYSFPTLTIAPDGSATGPVTDVNGNCQSVTLPAGSFTEIPVQVSSEVDVYANTATAENTPGWMFNRDPSTTTPYIFNAAQASIGNGAIYVNPIGATPANKFIAENFLNKPIANINSISYDIRVGAGGSAVSANQFYMNVYANFGVSDDLKFYDCRYNVVPTVVSNGAWTTVTFDPTQAYDVATRGGASASPFTCPSAPADMDGLSPGSNIRMFALNLGDTSASDVGLDGYFDKVVVNTDTALTTYDFEPVSGEIVKPTAGKHVSGWLKLKATYNDGDMLNDDTVNWAVRKGTCAANTNTVLGNVDGRTDAFQWDGKTFSAKLDVRALTAGEYCFVFNPTDDANQLDIRETRNFFIDAFVPKHLEDCFWGGWRDYLNPSFKNQGQCVKYVVQNMPKHHKKHRYHWGW